MNLAQVIEWKYGPVADCNLSDGSIINWRHPTISQPTTSQLTLDTAEYVAFISGRAANDDIKRQLAALDAKRIRRMLPYA